jgi:hypothetical protein
LPGTAMALPFGIILDRLGVTLCPAGITFSHF